MQRQIKGPNQVCHILLAFTLACYIAYSPLSLKGIHRLSGPKNRHLLCGQETRQTRSARLSVAIQVGNETGVAAALQESDAILTEVSIIAYISKSDYW